MDQLNFFLNLPQTKKYKKGMAETHARNHKIVSYLLELVSKADPLLLHQYLKTTDGAIVGIQHQHGQ